MPWPDEIQVTPNTAFEWAHYYARGGDGYFALLVFGETHPKRQLSLKEVEKIAPVKNRRGA
jgi:hypothetical protein